MVGFFPQQTQSDVQTVAGIPEVQKELICLCPLYCIYFKKPNSLLFSRVFVCYQLTIHVFFLSRAFDVELLYIAQRLKIALAEVAINWTEIDGLYTTYFTNSYMLLKMEDLSRMKFFVLEYSLLYTRETLQFSLPSVNFKHQRYQKQQGQKGTTQ